MILELDCGNTSIKWRLLACEGVSATRIHEASTLLEITEKLIQHKSEIVFCRVCSVRSTTFNDALTQWAVTTLTLTPVFARSTVELAGVVNGYQVASALGADRWLAIVAAHTLYRMNCLILDCGTAITSDFVTQQGKHLGGMIAPGINLLEKSLSLGTGLPSATKSRCVQVARKTDLAIDSGITSMYQGFVQEQIRRAEQLFQGDFMLVLTGGDAELVRGVEGVQLHKELVFTGLALACPVKD